MTRVVHVQTTVQTVFGVLDDQGNVIPQQPVTVTVGLFNPEAFAEAYEAIAQARDEAAENMTSAQE
jgi:hypothetical protein